MMSFKMDIATKLLFGSGQLNNLHQEELPGKKALIVISNGTSAKKYGYLEKTEEQLKKAGAETVLFDQIEANPLKSTVMAGARMAADNNCDFVVALGGGSSMDAAKSIALMAVNEGDYWDYIPGGTGKGKEVKNTPLPVIAITTTAGTGSEVDRGTVITNSETNEKIGFIHPDLLPEIAVVDPELMTTVPPKYTAFQGFDALFHSIEGYLSKFTNKMSDMYAITAVKNIAEGLPKAVENGDNLKAREKVAFANTLSGLVMEVGALTSQHSLEHAMSAFHQELPHGSGLIMLSRAYFGKMIERGAAEERFIELAKALGKDDAERAEDFLTALEQLQQKCGVAELKMSNYGIKEDEFEAMAENARETMGELFQCDRSELSLEDTVDIYQKAYK